MVALWPQEGGTITFFSFSILLLLGPGCKHSHTSMKQKEVTNDSAWWPKDQKGEHRVTEKNLRDCAMDWMFMSP